jgi:predicted nucleotidyltransferase
MPVNKKDILNTLRDIKPILQQDYYLTELALFGSYARDEQTEKSDIDIMVVTNGGSFRDYCNLYYKLEESFPKHTVQMVNKLAIKPPYFERLKNDLLYV